MAIADDIKLVDKAERARQHVLSNALWAKLEAGGVDSGDPGRITSFLLAADSSKAAELAARFNKPSSGWQSEVSVPEADDEERLFCITILSPEVALSRAALLDLADVMLVAAFDHQCIFEGFEVESRSPTP